MTDWTRTPHAHVPEHMLEVAEVFPPLCAKCGLPAHNSIHDDRLQRPELAADPGIGGRIVRTVELLNGRRLEGPFVVVVDTMGHALCLRAWDEKERRMENEGAIVPITSVAAMAPREGEEFR